MLRRVLSFGPPLAVAAACVVGGGCGGAHDDVAAQVERARVAYFRAEAGPATVLAAGELRESRRLLDAAEDVLRRRPDDPRAADMAYVAAREAELAESHAGLILARRRLTEARRELAAVGGTR
jgi:hypothetical protein